MQTWALLLAAGSGTRLAECTGTLPKQFLPFQGAPLFWHSALALSRLPALRGIVFVFPSPHTATSGAPDPESLIRTLDAGGLLGLPWKIAYGGERRQDSVHNGLQALPAACETVLVHDAARPFASTALASRVFDGLKEGHPAVIPGIAVADTIKSVDASGMVRRTHNRPFLRAVQTPQGFSASLLRQSHAVAAERGWEATDDAALMERCGYPVLVVDGEEGNRKITTPGDLELLDARRAHGREQAPALPDMLPCIGFGYDVHRYGGERPFILGGVPIPCNITVAAHSDGDTLFHALMDALLGAVGAGDIGQMFPDTDSAFDNISSGILLSEVLEKATLAGLVITHVDITVAAQVPRIAPHREAIARNVAQMLQLPRGWVNVKATTEERLGFTGEKKGIKVMAVVSGLKPRDPQPDVSGPVCGGSAS